MRKSAIDVVVAKNEEIEQLRSSLTLAQQRCADLQSRLTEAERRLSDAHGAIAAYLRGDVGDKELADVINDTLTSPPASAIAEEK